MALQLAVNVALRKGQVVGNVALQCCGLLTEHLEQSVMTCDECERDYSVASINELIDEAMKQLDDLRAALTVR
ncbi:MAG: hypothetical protein JXA21_06805 [Anaerolineae bacterium]|nr:hypothetical protein [Anaerolineae bacterium]